MLRPAILGRVAPDPLLLKENLMPYHLAGQVLFAGNGDRNRARNAVQNMLTDWNGTHPVEERFTQVRFNNVSLLGEADSEGEVAGQSYPSIDFEYTCPSEGPTLMAQQAVHFDIDSNAYVVIRGLSVYLD
jgi:hypothetical protein